MTRLAKSGLLLFGLLALHTVDHAVNQPARDLPAGSGVVGIAGFALVAVAIVFALFHSCYSAEVGLFAGAGTLIGFVAVHLPGIGPLADPFPDFSPNALSWILVAAPMLASVCVAAIAIRELRGERLRPPVAANPQRS